MNIKEIIRKYGREALLSGIKQEEKQEEERVLSEKAEIDARRREKGDQIRKKRDEDKRKGKERMNR